MTALPSVPRRSNSRQRGRPADAYVYVGDGVVYAPPIPESWHRTQPLTT